MAKVPVIGKIYYNMFEIQGKIMNLPDSGGSTLGPVGTGPPNLAQAPQIFGHSSSATG